MSIDGPAWYWFARDSKYVEREYIQVLEAWTRPAGPDPYGAVTSGELTLSYSYLIRGRAITAGESGDLDYVVKVQTEMGDFPIHADCLEDASGADGVLYLLPVIRDNAGSTRQDPSTGGIVYPMIRGLGLRACGHSKGRFSRVGQFHYGTLDREDVYKALTESLDKVGQSTAAAACAKILSSSEHEQRRYVIVIE